MTKHSRDMSFHEPKAGLPLLARILGWLLLNLLLLALVFYGLLQLQFPLGINALLAGPAGQRIQAVSEALAGALRERPREEWSQVLESFSAAYKVQLGLFEPGGHPVAGEVENLPETVRERLIEWRGPMGRQGMGPPPGKGRRFMAEAEPEPQTMFSLRTTNPTRYWVGVRMPLHEVRLEGPRRPMPLTLLLATDSLYSGTLFLDLRLWLVAGLGTLLLSILLWIPPVRGLTRALSQLTRATDSIANGDFSARVHVRRTDEVGRLSHSVNRLAERLDGFVKGQKRFLGDTAHELCSPLARIQVGLGILEQTALPNQKPALEDVREEVEEMGGLINELLSFSKASLGRTDAPLEPVSIAEIVRSAVERESLENDGLKLAIEEPLKVMARPDLLRRALANLLRNAKRYAGAEGPIEITVTRAQDKVILTVTDQGKGVPEADLERIFDPFYRSEASRSRDTGGAGLGLAIVKSCVEACGGRVFAKNLKEGGFQVVVILQAA